jgi:hypothetical protein
VSRGFGVVGSKLLLQHCYNRIVPGVMKILLCRHNVNLLARSPAIGIRGGMQRLVNVTNEMDEKRKVAGAAPFIIIAIAKATGVLVDFGRDAISA